MVKMAAFTFLVMGLSSCNDDSAPRQQSSQNYSGQNSAIMADSMEMPVVSPNMKTTNSTSDDTGSPNTSSKDDVSLAYRHHFDAEAPFIRVPEIINEMTSYCMELSGCIVLESGNSKHNKQSQGHFTARAIPESIDALEKKLKQSNGELEITSESTTAEDLSGPLTDVERRISMLKNQREQLEILQSRDDNNIESLLRTVKELSSVQSNIEAAEGHIKSLRQRVDREIWSLSITSKETVEEQMGPIAKAFQRFPNMLADATASLVIFIAYTLPWGVMALIAGPIVMIPIRRRRNKKAGISLLKKKS